MWRKKYRKPIRSGKSIEGSVVYSIAGFKPVSIHPEQTEKEKKKSEKVRKGKGRRTVGAYNRTDTVQPAGIFSKGSGEYQDSEISAGYSRGWVSDVREVELSRKITKRSDGLYEGDFAVKHVDLGESVTPDQPSDERRIRVVEHIPRGAKRIMMFAHGVDQNLSSAYLKNYLAVIEEHNRIYPDDKIGFVSYDPSGYGHSGDVVEPGDIGLKMDFRLVLDYLKTKKSLGGKELPVIVNANSISNGPVLETIAELALEAKRDGLKFTDVSSIKGFIGQVPFTKLSELATENFRANLLASSKSLGSSRFSPIDAIKLLPKEMPVQLIQGTSNAGYGVASKLAKKGSDVIMMRSYVSELAASRIPLGGTEISPTEIVVASGLNHSLKDPKTGKFGAYFRHVVDFGSKAAKHNLGRCRFQVFDTSKVAVSTLAAKDAKLEGRDLTDAEKRDLEKRVVQKHSEMTKFYKKQDKYQSSYQSLQMKIEQLNANCEYIAFFILEHKRNYKKLSADEEKAFDIKIRPENKIIGQVEKVFLNKKLDYEQKKEALEALIKKEHAKISKVEAKAKWLLDYKSKYFTLEQRQQYMHGIGIEDSKLSKSSERKIGKFRGALENKIKSFIDKVVHREGKSLYK